MLLSCFGRLDDPPFGLVLLGRDPAHSWNQTFGPGVEIQSRSPFLLYRSLDGSTGKENLMEQSHWPFCDNVMRMFPLQVA